MTPHIDETFIAMLQLTVKGRARGDDDWLPRRVVRIDATQFAMQPLQAEVRPNTPSKPHALLLCSVFVATSAHVAMLLASACAALAAWLWPKHHVECCSSSWTVYRRHSPRAAPPPLRLTRCRTAG